MKTIVETATSLSKYLLEDDLAVTVDTDHVIVGDPPQLIVSDLNADNSVVYEGVTAPADWVGNKYTFDGSNWTPNPAYINVDEV